MTVNFDATNSSDPEGTITSYEWDLGNGTTATTATVSTTYTSIGNYVVELIVTNNNGLKDTAYATINVSNFPNDNPVASFYGATEYPWTDLISWGNVVNIADYGSDPTGVNDNLAAFNAAKVDPALATGGVLYFPAGTYKFSDDMIVPAGIVLRGDPPLPGEDDAKQSTFNLPTKFEFPQYIFTETGTGTDNSTAFKQILLDPAISTTSSNSGIVHIDINRAGIDFEAADEANATGENHVFFGIRTNNVGSPTPGVPNTSKGQFGYERHQYRFTYNIKAYNKKNLLVANTRSNDNITDNYAYQDYGLQTFDKSANTVISGGKYVFDYAAHYVIEVGQGNGGCSAGTPSTCPENFREGIDIRDNWMYHTLRVGILARGQGLKIRDNIVTDKVGKVEWVHPTGTRLVGNATTLENRGIDWAGWDVTVSGNDVQVQRHKLRDGPYLSVDGEGILLQECCGGTTINGVDITNNTVNSYIGLYKSRDINDAYVAYNTVTTGQTDLPIIWISADRNVADHKIDNTIVEFNNLSGSHADILFLGSGAAGSNNFIRNNTSTGGTIEYSCLTNASITSNTGFTVLACTGPTARKRAPQANAFDTPIKLYPNPTGNRLNIEVQFEEQASFRIFDMMGKVVYEQPNATVQQQVELQRFGAGLYFVQLNRDGEKSIHKIRVQ